MTSSALVVRRDHRDYEIVMVVAGFLAGYTGNTRLAYQQDLREFGSWCRIQNLDVLGVRRAHIELFARSQETMGRARGFILELAGAAIPALIFMSTAVMGIWVITTAGQSVP